MNRTFRFSCRQRIRRSQEYQAVFANGEVASDNVLVIHVLRSSGSTRLGISVSRRVGGAVVRNRWKRLIREAFRLNYRRLPDSLAMIVRPRRGAKAELSAIALSMVRLAGRLDRRALKILKD